MLYCLEAVGALVEVLVRGGNIRCLPAEAVALYVAILDGAGDALGSSGGDIVFEGGLKKLAQVMGLPKSRVELDLAVLKVEGLIADRGKQLVVLDPEGVGDV